MLIFRWRTSSVSVYPEVELLTSSRTRNAFTSEKIVILLAMYHLQICNIYGRY